MLVVLVIKKILYLNLKWVLVWSRLPRWSSKTRVMNILRLWMCEPKPKEIRGTLRTPFTFLLVRWRRDWVSSKRKTLIWSIVRPEVAARLPLIFWITTDSKLSIWREVMIDGTPWPRIILRNVVSYTERSVISSKSLQI